MQLNTYVTALEREGRPGALCVFDRDPLRKECLRLHNTTKAILSRHQSLSRHVKALESETSKLLKSIRMLIRRGRDIIDQRQDYRTPDAEKERELLNEFQRCIIPHQSAQNAKFECEQLSKKMATIFAEVGLLREDKRYAKRRKMTQLIVPFCEQMSKNYSMLGLLTASVDRMLLDYDVLKKCLESATGKGSLRRALIMFSNLGFERAIDRVQERVYFIRLWQAKNS